MFDLLVLLGIFRDAQRGPKLRGYQNHIVKEVDGSFASGHLRVLVESMTGSGKTTVGASLVLAEVQRARRVLWLAHRKELIIQARDRLEEFGANGGVIKAGYEEELSLSLQVGSVQSTVGRLNRIGDFDFIVIDEAHHALASSYVKILEAFPKARVIGLTATPWRFDGRGLGEVFEHMVPGPTPDDLIEAGFILPARVIGSDRGIDFGAFVRGGEYSISEMEEAIALKDLDGDAARSFLDLFPDSGTAVVFCRSVDHAVKVAQDFEEAGVPSAVLTGDTPDAERDAMLADLQTEEIRTVCSVDVISEGYDLPAISCVVMLRKTKSLSLFLQQAGRALRPSPGKTEAVILDLVGNSMEHGHPCSTRSWTLEAEDPAARAEQKTDDGEDLSIRRCPECLCIHEVAPVCPVCGYKHVPDTRIPKVKLRELREIEKAELEALQEQRRAERKAEEKKCKSLDDWRALATERGYKPGWALVQWRLRS